MSKAYRLVLHPKNAEYAPDSWQAVISALQQAGFLGESCSVDATPRFFIGDHFLQMITFMGCSPHIEVEPPTPGSIDFCHVAFSEISAIPRFRHHDRDVFARCPECGRRDSNWMQFISAWEQDPAMNYTCPSCGASIKPEAIRWRQTAGFARVFIDVYSVFPHEGVPTPQLLSLLKNASDDDWDYFYCHC